MEPKTKLFLHMGPGFHSQIESHLFGASVPEMKFWDQPKVNSFSELVSSAEEVFVNLKQEKVDLYGHSFGSQLALKLVKAFPNKIGKIVLLNSSVNPFNCFLNIGLKLNVLNQSEASKLKSASSFGKMEAIFKIASAPEFNSVYWFSHDKQKQIETTCFSKFPPIDLNVFARVFKDFLEQVDPLSNPTPWPGQVQVIYSEDDILLDYKSDLATWSQLFPSVSFKSVKGVGHYAHLEDEAISSLFFR